MNLKIAKAVFLAIIVFLLIKTIKPVWIDQTFSYLSDQVDSAGLPKVLGIADSEIPGQITSAGSWFLSLPFVTSIKNQAESAVNSKIEELMQIPQKEVEKTKNDLREKVCGQWPEE